MNIAENVMMIKKYVLNVLKIGNHSMGNVITY